VVASNCRGNANLASSQSGTPGRDLGLVSGNALVRECRLRAALGWIVG
jgi:hypothetical protein